MVRFLQFSLSQTHRGRDVADHAQYRFRDGVGELEAVFEKVSPNETQYGRQNMCRKAFLLGKSAKAIRLDEDYHRYTNTNTRATQCRRGTAVFDWCRRGGPLIRCAIAKELNTVLRHFPSPRHAFTV